MRRLVVLSVLLGFAGCVTPSIPIPPPDPSKMSFAVGTDGSGSIVSASLRYPSTTAYAGGLVYVFNRSKGKGIIELVNSDDSIGPTTPVEASASDQLVVSVESDEQTVSTCVLLQEGTPASYCP